MKAYTNIEQSKKLAEFLPLESADMCYPLPCEDGDKPLLEQGGLGSAPCWSLDALLDYLSANFHVDIKYLDNYWELDCHVQVLYGKELIDVCYEMLIRFNELKML